MIAPPTWPPIEVAGVVTVNVELFVPTVAELVIVIDDSVPSEVSDDVTTFAARVVPVSVPAAAAVDRVVHDGAVLEPLDVRT